MPESYSLKGLFWVSGRGSYDQNVWCRYDGASLFITITKSFRYWGVIFNDRCTRGHSRTTAASHTTVEIKSTDAIGLRSSEFPLHLATTVTHIRKRRALGCFIKGRCVLVSGAPSGVLLHSLGPARTGPWQVYSASP